MTGGVRAHFAEEAQRAVAVAGRGTGRESDEDEDEDHGLLHFEEVRVLTET
jgi:hypothetical protein